MASLQLIAMETILNNISKVSPHPPPQKKIPKSGKCFKMEFIERLRVQFYYNVGTRLTEAFIKYKEL